MYQSQFCYNHGGHKHEVENASLPTEEDPTHEQQGGGEDLWWTEEDESQGPETPSSPINSQIEPDESLGFEVPEAQEAPEDEEVPKEYECRFFASCNNMTVYQHEGGTCADCLALNSGWKTAGAAFSVLFYLYVLRWLWLFGTPPSFPLVFYGAMVCVIFLSGWRWTDNNDPSSANIEYLGTGLISGFFHCVLATFAIIIVSVVAVILYVVLSIVYLFLYYFG